MGLNRLFRRFTENRISVRQNNAQEKSEKAVQNGCNFTIGDTDGEAISNSSPDILNTCVDTERSRNKKFSAPLSLDYPSCPMLSTPSAVNAKNNCRSSTAGVGGCCASSSSSLVDHQPTQEKHQWFSRRKSGSLFLRSKKNATQNSSSNNNRQQPTKKYSWLSTSPSFFRNNFSISLQVQANSINVENKCKVVLPDVLLLKCLNTIDNPFELCRLRILNRSTFHQIQRRLERIVEMDVRKINLDSFTPSSKGASTFIIDHEVYYSHPAGYRVLMRFADGGSRVKILVDDCWTSRDVVLLCRILDAFRLTLRNIVLDAQIFELVIASLSIIDLDRWYAFQCFMKAVNDFQIHLAVAQIPQNVEGFYWPLAESLIIRSTEHDSVHLSRVLDYGVRSQLVMDRRRLNTLKVILTDVEKMNRSLTRNLYHFRCWAGSAGFDDRFSQHFCPEYESVSRQQQHQALIC